MSCRFAVVEEAVVPVEADATKTTPLLTPLYAPETTIQPDAEDCSVTVNTALFAPWGTMIAAGILSAALVLVSTTGMFPAALEMFTAQETLVPRLIFVVGQVSDTNAGVDQRVSAAD